MKTLTLTSALIVLLLWSCSSDPEVSPGNNNTSGGPAWQQGYPVVAYGAVSADLNVQCDRNAKVYYVVADKALNLTAQELKKNAASPTTSSIKFNGVVDVAANKELRNELKNLPERTKYFVYLIAQNKSDTLMQDAIKSIEFKTHSRQDTAEYNSTAENRKVKYLIYRPEEVLKYPNTKYPICYFLGGNGEVATDDKPINMIRNGSLPEYIHKGNDVPMMVFSIQHTVSNWNVSLIHEGITHGNATYPVNENKVYLTGISGGGFGCWNYAVNHADKLAAIVPISGGGDNNKACNLKNVAVYAFHNQTDNIVAASNSQNMINALNACPSNKEVKYVTFPDTGHDCWRRVYDQNHANWSKSPSVPKIDIYAWMLSKTK